MQRNFDKLIDEGMYLLEGEEADAKYIEIWEKVKRMQKLQETQEEFLPQEEEEDQD
jgi:predicted RNA-binding protein with EMAP domain